MSKRDEEFRTSMRSARMPLLGAMRKIDHAVDYEPRIKEAAFALKQARLAVKIMEKAIKKRWAKQ